MKKAIFIIFFVTGFCSSKIGFSQNTWIWANMIKGNNHTSGYDIAIDTNNNIYVVGAFNDTVTFGNQTEGGFCHPCHSGYILKYTPDGAISWVKVFKSPYSNFVQDIVIDNNNDIIISGIFQSMLWFDTDTLNSVYPSSAFLAKLNTDGDFIWVEQGDDTTEISVVALATDNMNNIYLAGNSSTPAFFGNLASEGSGAYIVKYNANGSPSKIISEKGYQIRTLNINNNYDFFISGILEDTLLIGNDTLAPYDYYDYYYSDTDTDTVHIISPDLLFLRHDSTGNNIWHKSAKSRGLYDYTTAAVLDENSNFYLAGKAEDSTDFWGTTLPDFFSYQAGFSFLVKIDSVGNVIWLEYGTPISSSGRIFFNDIFYKNGFLYTVGFPWYQSLFCDLYFNNTGIYRNTFLFKLDTAGNGLWIESDTTNLYTNGPSGISVDSDNNIIIIGGMQGPVHFGEFNLINTNLDDVNFYIAKMDSISVGINELTENEITVFPNPTSRTLTIKEGKFYNLKLFNTFGQTVAEASNANQLNVSSIANGLFLLQIFDKKGALLKTEKVVKE